MVRARSQPGLSARHHEGRARAQPGELFLVGEPPQRAEVGPGRVAVEAHHGRPDEQAGDEVVPHHPAGRREPGEPVVGAEVGVEREHLEVFEENPAVTVHDRLGHAGGPRREEHVERMVGSDLRESGFPGPADELVPRDVVARRGVQVRDANGRAHRREAGAQRVDLVVSVQSARAVPVAVDDEQHGRLDLGEAVEHGARAELRRARRPHRAEARGREERDDRLRNVGEKRGHAVAGPDAEAREPGPGARDLIGELVPRELDACRVCETPTTAGSLPRRLSACCA